VPEIDWTALWCSGAVSASPPGLASRPLGGEGRISICCIEWGLGGRRFGTVVTWFLVGGDTLHRLYVHRRSRARLRHRAIAFLCGSLIPSSSIPAVLVFPRLWNVCHKPATSRRPISVRGRFGNRWLALREPSPASWLPFLHRAGSCRHPGGGRGARCDGKRPGRRFAGLSSLSPWLAAIHLFERASRARLDRDRQRHLSTSRPSPLSSSCP